MVAMDLLAQAEHDEAAQSIMITDDADFGDAVATAVAAGTAIGAPVVVATPKPPVVVSASPAPRIWQVPVAVSGVSPTLMPPRSPKLPKIRAYERLDM